MAQPQYLFHNIGDKKNFVQFIDYTKNLIGYTKSEEALTLNSLNHKRGRSDPNAASN